MDFRGASLSRLPTILATMRPIQWAWHYAMTTIWRLSRPRDLCPGGFRSPTICLQAPGPYQDIDVPGCANRAVSLSIFVNPMFAAADQGNLLIKSSARAPKKAPRAAVAITTDGDHFNASFGEA